MSIDISKLRALACVRLECIPEDCEVRGNALASGDDAEDRREEDRILAELERGNTWAWCTARVVAEYAGLIGEDYLGCCSYRDEADFRAPGGYFDDMMATALEELAESLEEADLALAEVRHA